MPGFCVYVCYVLEIRDVIKMFERADLRGWKLSACIVLGSVTGA